MSNHTHQCARRENADQENGNTDNNKSHSSNVSNCKNSSMKGDESYSASTDTITSFKNQVLEKRRKIEDKILESSQRSLDMLQTSEDIAVSTCKELSIQREQLERSNTRLGVINSTLKVSSRYISGIKNVFGSFKNFISNIREESMASKSGKQNVYHHDELIYQNNDKEAQQIKSRALHPGLRIRGMDENLNERSGEFDKQLKVNLDSIDNSVSRLKSLALEMGREIDDHNRLIDDITVKTEKAVASLESQNKDLRNLIN
uniref:t-SNARE coiled-coil homology domain-containing protein n=1 Tax=Cuerna arida TaxID=1464854 RepID=A0A1B6EJ51_9HEMI